MSSQAITAPLGVSRSFAKKAIDGSAKFWFATVLVGQAIFSFYIIALYYTATITNDLERFNSVMPGGYIEGDVWGNLAVVSHVILAAVITFGGLIQLFPAIRGKVPALHRWNGRIYILTAFVMSLSGTFMILTRSDLIVGDLFSHIAILINGAIIMTSAFMAIKLARQKKFAKHRVWALRLFVAVSGVWFFRVGLMVWLLIHGKPVGFDPISFSGPFLSFLQTLVYILPLAFLEVYLRVQAKGSPNQRFFTAIGIVLLSILLIGGIFGATMGMWLPRV